MPVKTKFCYINRLKPFQFVSYATKQLILVKSGIIFHEYFQWIKINYRQVYCNTTKARCISLQKKSAEAVLLNAQRGSKTIFTLGDNKIVCWKLVKLERRWCCYSSYSIIGKKQWKKKRNFGCSMLNFLAKGIQLRLCTSQDYENWCGTNLNFDANLWQVWLVLLTTYLFCHTNLLPFRFLDSPLKHFDGQDETWN